MQYYHSLQMVHRDIKPSNILITNNGKNVRLIDFGLSDTDWYAVFKEPAFTRYYASPEQLEGGKLDCRSDIYSFGRVLQQIFPHKYKRVVKRCTQNKREKRYPNAEAVYKAMFSAWRWIIPALCLIFIGCCLIFIGYYQIYFRTEPFDYKVAKNQILKVQIIDSKAVIISGQDVSGELVIPKQIRKGLRKFPIREILPKAFENNKQLTKIVLPEGLHYIRYNAFASCNNLSDTVILPISLKGIGNYAFGGSGIECVVIKSSNLHSLDTINYHDDFAGCFALKTVIVENTADSLCPFLFERASDALENVYFPDTLDRIATAFLAYSHKLKNIRLPKTLNSVGNGAFFASGIQRVVLPQSVKQIEGYAFRMCWQLRYLEIGEQIEYIEELAMADMEAIDTLVIRAKIPPNTANNAFQGTNGHSFTVLVPEGSLELYKKDKVFNKLNIQPIKKGN